MCYGLICCRQKSAHATNFAATFSSAAIFASPTKFAAAAKLAAAVKFAAAANSAAVKFSAVAYFFATAAPAPPPYGYGLMVFDSCSAALKAPNALPFFLKPLFSPSVNFFSLLSK